MQTFQRDPSVDYNKIPQRFERYPASDRAKTIVHEAITIDSLFGGGWPFQWSSPEGAAHIPKATAGVV